MPFFNSDSVHQTISRSSTAMQNVNSSMEVTAVLSAIYGDPVTSIDTETTVDGETRTRYTTSRQSGLTTMERVYERRNGRMTLLSEDVTQLRIEGFSPLSPAIDGATYSYVFNPSASTATASSSMNIRLSSGTQFTDPPITTQPAPTPPSEFRVTGAPHTIDRDRYYALNDLYESCASFCDQLPPEVRAALHAIPGVTHDCTYEAQNSAQEHLDDE